MIVVNVYRNQNALDEETMKLVEALPAIIAKVLNASDDSDGRLAEEDVEVVVMDKQ